MLPIQTLKRLTGGRVKGLASITFLTVVDAFLASAPFGFVYYILLDMLSSTPSLNYQLFLCLVCVAMIVFRAMLARAIHVNINLIGFNAGRTVRERLGEHLRQMPMGFFQKSDFGGVNNTLLKDVDRVEHIFTHLYAPIIATASVLVFFAVGLTLKDWRMGAAMLSTLPLALLAYVLTSAYARKWQSYMQRLMYNLNDTLLEYMDGIKELKAHSITGKMFKRLDGILEETRQKSMPAERAAAWPVYSFNLLVECGFLVVLVTLTFFWLEQSITLAEVLLFLIAAMRFFRPLLNMSMFMAELNYMKLAVNRIEDLMSRPVMESGGERPQLTDLTISFDKVCFNYEPSAVLFQSLDLTIPQGKVTALVGSSGSGKSTIASLVARFWNIESGNIWLGQGANKINLASLEVEHWLKYVSVVFQSSYLFSDTIANNLRVAAPNASDDELWQALDKAKLKTRVEAMEDSLQTLVGAQGVHLSGGEKQRLTIARALLKNAPVVILDEATASLDPENERDIQLAMQTLIEGKTVLVIAHKLSTVQFADNVVVLEQGKIVEQGNHQQLLRLEGIYYELWQLQQQAQSWRLTNSHQSVNDAEGV
ncbi:ABC transporter ATP-binding protein/permease [Vibrio kasasachensis]|uniref:ABC transporter ATP-binding protein n=1 Tax=Vibrio kasasachensis TaxID=2910248 RepID=UPI003D14CEB0